jgi:hypothetical protein
MIRIFSNLNLLEAHRSAKVCQRWRHVLASNECRSSIRHVDATEFLHHVHDACVSSCNSTATASTTTSQVLEREISQYRPDRLTIRDIGWRLSSEFCVPNVHRLVELTLTHYDNLTDLTLHAMLLLTSATSLSSSTDPDVWMHEHGRVQRTSGTSLQTLRLESCPLLSDAAVRSIALTCPNLRVLSLRGCRSIGSIVPLRALWNVAATTTSPVLINNVTSPTGLPMPSSTSSGKPIGIAPPLSLASLFVATSATTAAHPARAAAQRMGRSRPPHVESVCTVLPPPSPTSVATIVNEAEEEATKDPDLEWDVKSNRTSPLCLADLFSAPSPSPKSVPAPSPSFRSIVGSSAALPGPRCGGALIDLDVSDTGVPPAALLEALRSTPGPTSVVLFPTKVHLERLMARGSATNRGDCQLWMPRQLEELANLINVAAVKETDVGIFETTTTSSYEPQTAHVERHAHPGIRSH